MTPRAIVPQASLSMEFSRQEYWSGLPFTSPGYLPDPGIEPGSPKLQGEYLPSELTAWFNNYEVLFYVAVLDHTRHPRNIINICMYSSVAQSCLTLCDPIDCSMPGLHVHYQILVFTQTHVHRVSDAIQPSHPLWSPSPPTLNLSSVRVFSNESVLHIRWPKYWNFSFNISTSNEYSGLIYFRMDWLDLLAVQVMLKSSPTL